MNDEQFDRAVKAEPEAALMYADDRFSSEVICEEDAPVQTKTEVPTSSYDLINKLFTEVGALPFKCGNSRVAVLDSDTGVFTAQGASSIHWVNSQGLDVDLVLNNAADLYSALDQAHSQVLGSVLSGKGFQGPWVSDTLGRKWALLDVEVESSSRHPVSLVCQRIPDR